MQQIATTAGSGGGGGGSAGKVSAVDFKCLFYGIHLLLVLYWFLVVGWEHVILLNHCFCCYGIPIYNFSLGYEALLYTYTHQSTAPSSYLAILSAELTSLLQRYTNAQQLAQEALDESEGTTTYI